MATAARPATARTSSGMSDAALRQALVVLVALPLLAIPFRDSIVSFEDRLLAGLTWILCFVPTWTYLNTRPSRRAPIPFMPFVGFEYAVFFALEPVLGPVNLYGRFEAARFAPTLEPHLYTTSIRLLFVGWILLLAAHFVAIRSFRRPRSATRFVWHPKRLMAAAFLAVGVGALFSALSRTNFLPASLQSALFFGAALSLPGFAMLVVLNVRGLLSQGGKLGLYASLAAVLLLRAGSGATFQVLLVLLAILMAVWLGGKRITMRWFVAGIAAGMLILAIRGVVNEHRKSVGDVPTGGSLLSQSTLLVDIFSARLATRGPAGMLEDGWDAVVGRTALLDLFTDVVRQTPESVPYWGGRTYLSLVGAFIPRFLWPDKPAKTLGFEFAHRYHYTLENDYRTTINMPYLVEFYANFGALGVVLGMLVVGVLYGAVESVINRPGQDILASLIGLSMLMPLINIESDFSLVFGGIPLVAAALYMALRWARRMHLITAVRAPAPPEDGRGPGEGSAAPRPAPAPPLPPDLRWAGPEPRR